MVAVLAVVLSVHSRGFLPRGFLQRFSPAVLFNDSLQRFPPNSSLIHPTSTVPGLHRWYTPPQTNAFADVSEANSTAIRMASTGNPGAH